MLRTGTQNKSLRHASGGRGKEIPGQASLPKSAAQELREGKRPKTRVSVSELGAFLSKHRNRSTAFAAAFDLTGDPALIQQGLQKWPGSFALLARLLTTQSTSLQRKETVAAIINAAPNNSFGYYALAECLLQEGNAKEAHELISVAASKLPPETITPEDTLMRREAWESVGSSTLDAKLRSVMSEATLGVANILMALASTTQENSSSTIDPETTSLQLVSYLEHVRQNNYRSVQEEIIALSGQLQAFKAIDPVMEFGESGLTVGEQRRNVELELNRMTKFAAGLEKSLPNMSDAELGIYADRWLSLGEVAAMKALMKERGE